MLPGFLAALLLLLPLLSARAGYAASDPCRIELVTINMPDVTVCYRCPEDVTEVEAILGGETLTAGDQAVFAGTGEPVAYYVLMDISGSIDDSQFLACRDALSAFAGDWARLREQDQLVFYSFGDEVNCLLDGSEEREIASQRIAELSNQDQYTAFFEAVNEAAEDIKAAADAEEALVRRILLILSDGKDCGNNARGLSSVKKKLSENGIPVYAFVQANTEGDSETVRASYQGAFSDLALDSGGASWVLSKEQPFEESFRELIDDYVMGAWRGLFKAASNRVSYKEETLLMRFKGEAVWEDSKKILVSRCQADSEAPRILSAEKLGGNEIAVTYSEPVEGAGEAGNYTVKGAAGTVPVSQVRALETENAYALVFSEDLLSGRYEVSVSNVRDISNEKNPLAEAHTALDFEGRLPDSPTPSPAPSPTPTPQPEETLPEKVLRIWPLVLTLLVIVLIVIALSVYRKIKKQKRLLIIDDASVDPAQIREKIHVLQEGEKEDKPSLNLTLWLSNGRDEPKKIELTLKDSLIVGRRKEMCEIYCDDPSMSRQHFALSCENGLLMVSDLNSSNGTSVNGVRIGENYVLHSGDEIGAGNIFFRVEF